MMWSSFRYIHTCICIVWNFWRGSNLTFPIVQNTNNEINVKVSYLYSIYMWPIFLLIVLE